MEAIDLAPYSALDHCRATLSQLTKRVIGAAKQRASRRARAAATAAAAAAAAPLPPRRRRRPWRSDRQPATLPPHPHWKWID